MQKYFYTIVFFLALGFGQQTFCQIHFTPYDELPGINKSYKPAYSPDFPEWAKMLYAPELNFAKINQDFEAYMQQHPGEKSPIIRYFKIWRRACEPYVAADGSIHLPDLSQYNNTLRERQATYKQKPQKSPATNANWTFLGPKETFYLNETGTTTIPQACPWQVNVYAFDVAHTNDSILYAGTETGYVNKTTDKGLHWALVGQDYAFGGAVTAVAIHPADPNVVYVAAGNQVHKTLDGGQSWSPLLAAGNLFYADRLRLDTVDPAKLFAASANGLYMTADGGQTWSQQWPDAVYDVEIKPNDHNVIYALSKANGNFSLIMSLDGGQTFAVSAAFPTTYVENSGGLLAVSGANPEMVLAVLLSANNTPYLLKGTLSAGSWSWVLKATGQTLALGMNNGQGYFDLVLDVSPINENIIMVGTTTLFKSLNGGNTFTAVGGYSGNFRIHPDIQDIKMLPSGETWISTDGGMTITTDNFGNIANYKARVNGLIGSDMWGFDQGWNEDVVVGGRYHNGNTALADFYQPKALRMGGAESPTGWVLQGKSRHVAFDDLGNGWILPLTAETKYQGRFVFSKYPNMEEYGGRRGNLVFHPNYYGTIFLGEGTGLWKSTDMGVTYDLLFSFPNTVRYLQISYHNPDVLYADVLNNGLYKSMDGGLNWTLMPSLTADPYGSSFWKGKLFFAISPYDENKVYACLQNGTWSADIGKVFRSLDGGTTWEDWTGSLSEYMKCLVIQPTASGDDLVYLFTNTHNGNPAGVFLRKEGMADWTAFNNSYPAGMTVNLALPFFRDSKLRVAGNGGVWESPMEESDLPPIINPWIEKSHYDCFLDTLFFDDHSILNHSGASWHWSITPSPAYLEDPDIRNPRVVLGSPGNYSVSLTVTVNGQPYTKSIVDMVSASSCPSLEDCNNPDQIPKDLWTVKYVDSQEVNYPGLATMSFDNDPASIWHTRWSTGDDPYPHEIQLDLGQVWKIAKFIYLPRQEGTNGRIKDYELYITQDSLNWGIPRSTGQFLNTAAPQTLVLDSTVVGRYLKLRALSEVDGNPWASAAEFSLVGCYNTVGIAEQSEKDSPARAFPVPTSGIVSISLPNAMIEHYQVFSVLGQQMEKGVVQNKPQVLPLDLRGYPNGVYLIQLADGQGVVYRIKVVKE